MTTTDALVKALKRGPKAVERVQARLDDGGGSPPNSSLPPVPHFNRPHTGSA